MSKQLLFSFILLLQVTFIGAQDDVSYKTPPKAIADMLLAKPTPNITIDDKGEWMLFMESNSYPSVEELARPELKIAGLRINPSNFAPSRQNFINSLYLKNNSNAREYKIAGLPSPLSASSVTWSPNDKKVAFLQTTRDRVDLYIIDIATQKATKINKTALNALMGTPYYWYDDQTILYRTIVKSANAAPPKPAVPKGPAVQENYGKASPRPTFQDMIKSPHDEELFSFYGTAQLVKNTNGVEIKIGSPAIYSSVNISPDNKFLLIRTR